MKTVALYENGRILRADLRGTRDVDRSLGISQMPTCYPFAGWLNFPLEDIPSHKGRPTRIRHMCTNGVIAPCVYYDTDAGWKSNGGEKFARLDTCGPNMGGDDGEPTDPATCNGRQTRGQPPCNYPATDIPDAWPWHDVCLDCWDFSGPNFWFQTDSIRDWSWDTWGLKLMELMQDDAESGRFMRRGDENTAMGWDCFSCHVAPGALVRMAFILEVYRVQDKLSKTYDADVKNIWINGVVSVTLPLKECEKKNRP